MWLYLRRTLVRQQTLQQYHPAYCHRVFPFAAQAKPLNNKIVPNAPKFGGDYAAVFMPYLPHKSKVKLVLLAGAGVTPGYAGKIFALVNTTATLVFCSVGI